MAPLVHSRRHRSAPQVHYPIAYSKAPRVFGFVQAEIEAHGWALSGGRRGGVHGIFSWRVSPGTWRASAAPRGACAARRARRQPGAWALARRLARSAARDVGAFAEGPAVVGGRLDVLGIPDRDSALEQWVAHAAPGIARRRSLKVGRRPPELRVKAALDHNESLPGISSNPIDTSSLTSL